MAMVVALVGPATAAPQTAADFAADCNADGFVEVSGNQRYVGGSGVLDKPCAVVMEPGAKLVLRRVELTGVGLVAISSPARTTVKVVDSSITMSGPLELTAGCCAGDSEVPEQKGRVVVRRSDLSGTSVQLIASFDWPKGRVLVTRSTIEATGTLGIQIRASDLAGDKGRVTVRRSSLASAGDLQIETGSNGYTKIRRSSASATGTTLVTTGAGGICQSLRSSASLACS
ncbi:MAG: hypothetical protein ACR2PK_19265 [Acidimicrobiales bacterium]